MEEGKLMRSDGLEFIVCVFRCVVKRLYNYNHNAKLTGLFYKYSKNKEIL